MELESFDMELATLIAEEASRQADTVKLIASENYASEAVLSAMSCPVEMGGTAWENHLTDKYAEGYPGKRHYGGCEVVDQIEDLAILRAKTLFGAEHVNVQSHSGTQANLAAYAALLEPGDRVLAMDLAQGGHLSHGSRLSLSGKLYSFAHYGVSRETEMLDYDAIRRQAEEFRPKLIVAGATAYSRIIDWQALSKVAGSVDAMLMVDMAHIAGLVAGGMHPSPVPYADVVTTTTHKTLRGPRGGMIMSKAAYAKAIDRAVFPGTQGGPFMHLIASKAVCLKEAATPAFAVRKTPRSGMGESCCSADRPWSRRSASPPRLGYRRGGVHTPQLHLERSMDFRLQWRFVQAAGKVQPHFSRRTGDHHRRTLHLGYLLPSPVPGGQPGGDRVCHSLELRAEHDVDVEDGWVGQSGLPVRFRSYHYREVGALPPVGVWPVEGERHAGPCVEPGRRQIRHVNSESGVPGFRVLDSVPAIGAPMHHGRREQLQPQPIAGCYHDSLVVEPPDCVG